jgi:hypothetical protein
MRARRGLLHLETSSATKVGKASRKHQPGELTPAGWKFEPLVGLTEKYMLL